MTITAAPKSVSQSRDLGFGMLLMAAGIGCLVLLALSDARGQLSFPPDDSLYIVVNWLQAAAILVGGVLVAIPNLSRSTKAAAAAVALISSGMLLGTALWAMKHWASYRGVVGLDFQRVNEMERLTVFIAAASFIAAVIALWWLARANALSTHTPPNLRGLSVTVGTITIIALPLFVDLVIDEPGSLEVTMLGTFALLLSLPWGLSFILSGYMVRPAALGALAAAATSYGLWTLLILAEELDLVGAVLSLVFLLGVWLIALQARGGSPLPPEPEHE